MIRQRDDKTGINRRMTPRLVCSLDAFVLPGPLFCTVVDQSETGLRLSFQRDFDGWTKLMVVLMASGQAFAAHAKWHKNAEVGVSIISRCDLNGLVPSGFAEARQVWNRLRRAGDRETGLGRGR